jgi:hypothetical protein
VAHAEFSSVWFVSYPALKCGRVSAAQKKAPHSGMIKSVLLDCSQSLCKSLIYLGQAHYIKTSAYRVRPLQEDGNLAIDGERFPFGEYYAEVHRGLATVLSMSGRYAVDFDMPPPKSI